MLIHQPWINTHGSIPLKASRTALRRFYKQQRAALSSHSRAAAIAQITQHLISYPPLCQANHVAAFMATPTEVNLQSWIEHQWQKGGTVALPRVIPQHGMSFHRYTPDSDLVNSRFDIPEPAANRPKVPFTDFDAVLVPLVAFDSSGARLGMGGGYYDRFLAQLQSRCWIIGVAFANQYSTEPLPQDAWDIPLHSVVTENGVLEWRAHKADNC